MPRKKQKDKEEVWQILSIILVGVIILLVFFIGLKSQSPKIYSNENQDSKNEYKSQNIVENVEKEQEYYCQSEYTLCENKCYKCSEGYYLGVDCKCYPTDETLYEMASDDWQEHVTIIENDINNVNRIVDTYCPKGMLYSQVPSCVNSLQPRLQVYANHVIDAKEFLYAEGDIFSNKQTLLAGLDDDLVYINSQANYLETLVSEYNTWVANQNYQTQISREREEAVYDLLEILSGFSF